MCRKNILFSSSLLKKNSMVNTYSNKEISQKISSLLPPERISILKKISHLAQEENIKVYLIGGIVRDLLLDRKNFDIDLVVEEKGIEFAKIVARKFHGRLIAHEKFGTATIRFNSNFLLDISTARSEFYPYPGALPVVKFSSLREDLARRDFTINALAMQINGRYFGKIIDYFGGLRDLNHKMVRILHTLSFIDDPTRLFRAVRFETRLNFKMDRATLKLARQAIEEKYLNNLSAVRIKNEIVYLLSEKGAWKGLARLSELGVLEFVSSGWKIDEERIKLFKEMEKNIEKLNKYFKKTIKRWLTYLAILVDGMSHSQLREWFKKMKIGKKEINIVIRGHRKYAKIINILSQKKDLANSQIYFLLKDLAPENIVVLYTQASSAIARRRIELFLIKLKKIPLQINGNDLIAMGYHPSAIFQEVLKKVLAAKIDGKVKTKKEQINLAWDLMKNAAS